MASRGAVLRGALAIPGGARPTPAPQGSQNSAAFNGGRGFNAPSIGQVSPLAAQLANEGGYSYPYGGFLPRPPRAFTEGAFGPFSPILPVPVDAPPPGAERPEARRYDFQVGWNLPTGQPGNEGLKLANFSTLQSLADSFSIARACIEYRKNQVRGIEWDITPTPDAQKAYQSSPAKMADFGKRRAKALKFFSRPDRDYFTYATWVSAVLEEVLVFDALSLLIRPVRGRGRGKGVLGSDLDSLMLVNGPTIRPLIDLHGGTPRPPAPAYQQYLKGVPRSDYMTMIFADDLADSGLLGKEAAQFSGDQLMYIPMIPRPWTPYGFSAIERALIPIMTGLQKQAFQYDWFKEGSVPAAYVIPGDTAMTPNQLRELQDALNAIAGDPAWFQKIIVLPAGSHVEPQKHVTSADELDQWITQETTMAFGLTPMEIGVTPGRSNSSSGGAQNQMAKMTQDNSEDTGLTPILRYLADIFNIILSNVCNQPDMLFTCEGLQQEEDQDALTGTLVQQFQNGMRTLDECRQELNLQPYGLEESSEPVITTPQGPVPLSTAVANAVNASAQSAAATQQTQAQTENTQANTESTAARSQMAQESHEVRMNEPSQPQPGMPGQPRPTPTGAAGAEGRAEASPGRAAAQAANREVSTASKSEATAVVQKRAAAELDALARHLAKGRPVTTWDARFISPQTLAEVAKQLASGLAPADAVKAARTHAVITLPLSERERVMAGPKALAAGGSGQSSGLSQQPDITKVGPKGYIHGWIKVGDWAPSMSGDNAAEWSAGSKVPQEMYHGTPSSGKAGSVMENGFSTDEIGASSGNRGWAGEGIYLTERPEYAASYGISGDTGQVLHTHVVTRNPWDSSMGNRTDDDVWSFQNKYRSQHPGASQDDVSRAIRSEAERRGHDSIIQRGKDGKINEMVAFSPRQVTVTQSRLAMSVALSKSASTSLVQKASSPKWPGWQLDLQLAALYAPQIAAAFQEGIAAAKAFLVKLFEGQVRVTPSWAAQEVRKLIAAALQGTLTKLWTEGYVLGQQSGQAMLSAADLARRAAEAGEAAQAARDLAESTAESVVDWAGWEPGDYDAAALVADGPGLLRLLERWGLSILQSVAETKLDALTQQIASALAEGQSASQLASSITSLLSVPARAPVIAQTELARAITCGTLDVYQRNGVDKKEWLVAPDEGVCAICRENEANGAIPVTQAFLSGVDGPPGHPRCRCCLVPAVVNSFDLTSLQSQPLAPAYNVVPAPRPAPEMVKGAGDGSVTCDEGHRHGSATGAAGVIIRAPRPDGTLAYLLQQRNASADEPLTWSVFGGGLHPGEAPLAGAQREVREETGTTPDAYTISHSLTDDHGGWAYTTFLADAPATFWPSFDGSTPEESAGWGWFTPEEMRDLPLHPRFEQSTLPVLTRNVEKVGPHGYIHGWIKVGEDGSSNLGQEDFKEDSSDTTESVTDRAIRNVAARWQASDGDVHALAREDEVDDPSLSGQALKEHVAGVVMRRWQGSSGDAISTAATTHVATRLGLEPQLDERSLRTQEYIKAHPALDRATSSLGDAMYDGTQQWLADRGVTAVHVMRSTGAADEADDTRPFTSWTTDYGGLRHEAGWHVREATVPASRVFSMPPTGFGTLAESEVVLLPKSPAAEKQYHRVVSLNGQETWVTVPDAQMPAAGGGAMMMPPVPGGVSGVTAGGEPPHWNGSEPVPRLEQAPDDEDDAEAPVEGRVPSPRPTAFPAIYMDGYWPDDQVQPQAGYQSPGGERQVPPSTVGTPAGTQGTAKKRKKIRLSELVKVGPEGYIHGFICVRPPCGQKYSEAEFVVNKGIVMHDGSRVGRMRKNDDGTYSMTHYAADGTKTKLDAKYSTRAAAAQSIAPYHDVQALRADPDVASHAAVRDALDTAKTALASGDHDAAISSLGEARDAARAAGDDGLASHVEHVRSALADDEAVEPAAIGRAETEASASASQRFYDSLPGYHDSNPVRKDAFIAAEENASEDHESHTPAWYDSFSAGFEDALVGARSSQDSDDKLDYPQAFQEPHDEMDGGYSSKPESHVEDPGTGEVTDTWNVSDPQGNVIATITRHRDPRAQYPAGATVQSRDVSGNTQEFNSPRDAAESAAAQHEHSGGTPSAPSSLSPAWARAGVVNPQSLSKLSDTPGPITDKKSGVVIGYVKRTNDPDNPVSITHADGKVIFVGEHASYGSANLTNYHNKLVTNTSATGQPASELTSGIGKPASAAVESVLSGDREPPVTGVLNPAHIADAAAEEADLASKFEGLDPLGNTAGAECHDVALGTYQWALNHGLTNPVINSHANHTWVTAELNGHRVTIDPVAVNQGFGKPVIATEDDTSSVRAKPHRVYTSLDDYVAAEGHKVNVEWDTSPAEAGDVMAGQLDDELGPVSLHNYGGTPSSPAATEKPAITPSPAAMTEAGSPGSPVTSSSLAPVDASQAYRSILEAKKAKLTANEAKAVEDYADLSFSDVNQHLRAGKAPESYRNSDITHLDNVFDKVAPTSQAMVVHRGITNAAMSMFGSPGERVGDTFQDKAFVSTSANAKEAATTFGSTGYGNAHVHITVPAGTKVVKPGSLAYRKVEKELILPRGSNFRIDRDEVDADGRRHVHVTLQPVKAEVKPEQVAGSQVASSSVKAPPRTGTELWNSDDGKADLTKQQEEAIGRAWYNSRYSRTADRLRKGEDAPYYVNSAGKAQHADDITTLKNAIARSQPMTQDAVVYRHIEEPDKVFGSEPMKPGHVFTDKSFVSTTADRSYIDSFGGSAVNGEAKITIHLPQGTRAMRPTSGILESVRPRKLTTDPAESKEFTLPPGTKFHVISHTVTQIPDKYGSSTHAVHDVHFAVYPAEQDFSDATESPRLAVLDRPLTAADLSIDKKDGDGYITQAGTSVHLGDVIRSTAADGTDSYRVDDVNGNSGPEASSLAKAKNAWLKQHNAAVEAREVKPEHVPGSQIFTTPKK
jgi:8-oxo-dGTP pyrophosphatase MutT (NUDIX family)